MFRDGLALTRERTGFGERLIEKDYFCTFLLEELGRPSSELVFKGGTCLAKVHADFYRLSEDMDFTIPIASDIPRSQRSRKAAPFKAVLNELPGRLPFFRLIKPLAGANSSRQYVGTIAYTSLATAQEETIKIEIGLREPTSLPFFFVAACAFATASSHPPSPVALCYGKIRAVDGTILLSESEKTKQKWWTNRSSGDFRPKHEGQQLV